MAAKNLEELMERVRHWSERRQEDAAEILLDASPPGRILVIEDRAESVAWFSSGLKPLHEVAAVDTFEEALVRVKGGDYDLVVVLLLESSRPEES